MRKFLINVNGTSYNVEVEELNGSAAPAVAPAPAAAAPAPVAAPAPAAAPAATPAAAAPVPPVAGGTQVKCPQPGAILEVRVHVGDSVKEGDVLMILEAMKMENEILAPVTGKVLGVQVSKGTNANAGDILAVIG